MQVDNNPRGDTALQHCHIFQEKLNLGPLWVLAAQHYHVHEAVGIGVPERVKSRDHSCSPPATTHHISDKLVN